MTLSYQNSWDPPQFLTWSPFWILVPLLLAAGFSEPTRQESLPDPGAYRTPLSDSLIESNQWRTPQKEEQTWRATPPPSLHWRTPDPPRSSSPSSNRKIELFPKYRPGNAMDFDHINREEKPQIKVFEFGS